MVSQISVNYMSSNYFTCSSSKDTNSGSKQTRRLKMYKEYKQVKFNEMDMVGLKNDG